MSEGFGRLVEQEREIAAAASGESDFDRLMGRPVGSSKQKPSVQTPTQTKRIAEEFFLGMQREMLRLEMEVRAREAEDELMRRRSYPAVGIDFAFGGEQVYLGRRERDEERRRAYYGMPAMKEDFGDTVCAICLRAGCPCPRRLPRGVL